MRMICLVLCLAAIIGAGCSTLTTDATGKPDKRGKYTTKKVAGVTYSKQPTKTMSAKADAAIMRFLLIVAGIGAIGVLAGCISWWLDKSRRFPCPWWDELLIGAGIVACVALLGIYVYPWLKWILLAGAGSFAGYRAFIGLRATRKCRHDRAPDPGATETTSPQPDDSGA